MLYNLYSAFRFLFEVSCVIIAGCYGFRLEHKYTRIIVGIMLPLSIVFVWSIWGAPASPNTLKGVGKLLLEISIYTITAVLLYRMQLTKTSICFIVVGIINAFVNYKTVL